MPVHGPKSGSRQHPTYKRIEDDLRRKVSQGTWQAGAKVPSRIALTQEYGVDIRTVQRAVAALLSDGTFRSNSSRGTYVGDNGQSRESIADEFSEVFEPTPESGFIHTAPKPRTSSASNFATVGAAALFASTSQISLWTTQVAQSLEESLGGNSHISLLFADRYHGGSNPNLPLEKSVVSLIDQGVDILVVILEQNMDDIDMVLGRAAEAHIPVIFVSTCKIPRPVINIYMDDWLAGYNAARHMFDAGCSNMIYVASSSVNWLTERYDGARFALQSADLSPDTLAAFYWDDLFSGRSEAPGRERGRILGDYLADNDLITGGIIVNNDETAYGIIDVARERSLIAGRDYKMIAFDDQPISRLLQLTTMRPPLVEMGRELGRQILHVLHGSHSVVQVPFPWQIVPRRSTVSSSPHPGHFRLTRTRQY